MSDQRAKRIGKIIVKSVFTLFVMGVVSFPFLTGGMKNPGNPLSHKEITKFDSLLVKTFEFSSEYSSQNPSGEDASQNLLSAIPEFVTTPKGGIGWDIFGETKQNPYSYKDEEGMEWSGARPEFSDNLKKLDGQDVLIQGYMFPLGQEEKQSLFLLGPFPVSCPFHYHVTANLIIEVIAKTPLDFSYDAVNIKGRLELVSKDDEYNVFYRLHDAQVMN
jgi:hypothetical protein